MNTPQRYQLIAGEFTPDQAMHVLLSLVKSKIDFHNVEKLSNHERFGEDITRSEQRLAELKQLRETLRKVCQSAEKTGTPMKVRGWIEIQPVEPGRNALPGNRAFAVAEETTS